MPITNKRTFVAALLAVLATASGPHAWGQEWPSRPITVLVPQQAGTIQDMIARNLGDELSKTLKQPVVVDNRPSASQIVASSHLARSAPDGYTLMISAMPNVIKPGLLKNQGFSSNQDFAVIAHAVSLSTMLAVSPQTPANNLQEFIALLKAHPDKYLYGSAGVGTPMHMFLEQFNRDAGTRSVHVPYKTFQLIVPDVAANTLQYSFLPLGMVPLAKEGKFKPLGVVGPQRDPLAPDLPTLSEQGMKGFDVAIQYFVVGPKNLPVDIVNKLNAAIVAAQALDSYQAKYRALGGVIVPKGHSPAQAAALLKREDERFTALVREGKIPLE